MNVIMMTGVILLFLYDKLKFVLVGQKLSILSVYRMSDLAVKRLEV